VRRFNLMRSEERRSEWREYHASQAARLKVLMGALIAHHEQQAESLMSKDKEGSDKSDE